MEKNYKMENKTKNFLPPLRKNFFRHANMSEGPIRKDYFKASEKKSKEYFKIPFHKTKYRDLSVSPRYLQYHTDLVHKSKVSLLEDFQSFKVPHKTPINLVKLNDFELERWRLS